jgi:hypothetical protein
MSQNDACTHQHAEYQDTRGFSEEESSDSGGKEMGKFIPKPQHSESEQVTYFYRAQISSLCSRHN